MTERLKQILRELGVVLLFSVGLAALLGVVALAVGLAGDRGFAGVWWRLCAFGGGIVLIAASVLLLTNRAGSRKMAFWEKRFPHLAFTWAVLLVGLVLLLAAGVVNYLAF